MKKIYLLLLILGNSWFSIAQKPSERSFTKKPFTLGSTMTFFSPSLNEERAVNIYVPASYTSDTSKSYPVIYLLDGSADEDFIHIAGLVQFATFSWAQLIPESIVVGISNVDRKRDFTYPTQNIKDKKDFPTTGGSEQFIRYLETELQPFIGKQFRVTEERTLIGQSLGGLLASEILWTRPHLFSNYVIVSPSLWWDDNSLLSRKRIPQKTSKKVFVAVGKEGPTMEGAALGIAAALKPDRSIQSHFKYLDDLDHTNTLHQAVYEAFKVLYKKEKEPNHD
jgi:predicted alpha/beta superfamily hydrolase